MCLFFGLLINFVRPKLIGLSFHRLSDLILGRFKGKQFIRSICLGCKKLFVEFSFFFGLLGFFLFYIGLIAFFYVASMREIIVCCSCVL